LHEKYAREGVVVISVSLDDPSEKDGKGDKARPRTATVLEFLQQRQAAFTNLILDENQDFWTQKFSFVGPPCLFVFNREGKWKRFKGDEPHRDAEQLVESYLKK
jgi:hypothetical protein